MSSIAKEIENAVKADIETNTEFWFKAVLEEIKDEALLAAYLKESEKVNTNLLRMELD